MSTQVDEGLGVKTDLAQDEESLFLLDAEFDMDSELPCEHPKHQEDGDIHGGPGKWYMMTKCPNTACGKEWPLRLYCEPFKEYVTTTNDLAQCSGCLYVGRGSEFMGMVVPK